MRALTRTCHYDLRSLVAAPKEGVLLALDYHDEVYIACHWVFLCVPVLLYAYCTIMALILSVSEQ